MFMLSKSMGELGAAAVEEHRSAHDGTLVWKHIKADD